MKRKTYIQLFGVFAASGILSVFLYAANAAWNQQPAIIKAEAKLSAICDAKLTSINRRIGELTVKANRSSREESELQDLREQYDYWRAVCRGK